MIMSFIKWNRIKRPRPHGPSNSRGAGTGSAHGGESGWSTGSFAAESQPQPSKLDPFKKDIRRMLENHAYSAAQVLQRIGEQGFDGQSPVVQRVRAQGQTPKDPCLFDPVLCPRRLRSG